MVYIYVSNRNGGKRNPKVPVMISGQSVAEGTIGPTVWLGFGNMGIYQGVGFHTTISDAKKLKLALEDAIKIAEE